MEKGQYGRIECSYTWTSSPELSTNNNKSGFFTPESIKIRDSFGEKESHQKLEFRLTSHFSDRNHDRGTCILSLSYRHNGFLVSERDTLLRLRSISCELKKLTCKPWKKGRKGLEEEMIHLPNIIIHFQFIIFFLHFHDRYFTQFTTF